MKLAGISVLAEAWSTGSLTTIDAILGLCPAAASWMKVIAAMIPAVKPVIMSFHSIIIWGTGRAGYQLRGRPLRGQRSGVRNAGTFWP
jgi:hypothetical protein